VNLRLAGNLAAAYAAPEMRQLRPLLAAVLACVCLAAATLSGGAGAARRVTPPCATVSVLASRGSGDVLGKDQGLSAPGQLFVQTLNRLLGGVGFWANPYPAVGVFSWPWQHMSQLINGAGALTKLSGLGLGAYHASAVKGTTLLAQQIKRATSSGSCATTPLVLVGYSQGAQVTADVFQRDLTAAERKQIVAVVLFGDPYFNATDRAVDRGHFSGRRNGVLGMRPTFASGPLTLSFCHAHDPICQGFFIRLAGRNVAPDPGTVPPRQHTNYDKFGEPQQAAATVAKLLQTKPGPPAGGGSWPTHRNDGQPAFFEYLGASFISPDWSSCSGSWCIVGSANTVYVFSLANGIAQVATIPLATADPATALAALGVPAATVAALLKP
jgi:hypothetical protein